MSIHLVQNKPKDARKGTPAMAKGKKADNYIYK